jgi:glycosyltransferase involved in cell wall biosynthesis
MDLTIALEQRFAGTPDGRVWTATALARPYWSRYLGVFQRVRVLGRVQLVRDPDPRWQRVDGDGVEVMPVPHYIGPAEYLSHALAVERAVRAALDANPGDAAILRVPGTIGGIAARALARSGRRFAVEVVGDPYDTFAPGASDHPLRPAIRWWATRRLRALCAQADASLFVTNGALQRRYPPRSGTRAFAASDVETGDDAFVAAPRTPDWPAGPPFRLVHVGTLAALYKAPDLLLEAVARCAASGLDVELELIGDGRHRGELEALAARRGIGGRVRFVGQLPSGQAVRDALDRAHAFVLPSRQEGMPRAMIEAMARGLPCLGTAVGGIPELLPASALVPLDAAALAERIRQLAESPTWRAELSAAAVSRAREFHERALQPVREAFFRHVAALTEGAARHVRRGRAMDVAGV